MLPKADAMKNTRKAFTLVELLVVIAVISILAAMLLPVLNRAKMAADSAGCRSNLRQLTLGLAMYVQEHRAYPSDSSWSGVNAPAVSLAEELQPFTGARWPEQNYYGYRYLGPRRSIWACPGYNRVQGWFGPNDSAGKSYAYNSGGSLDFGRGLGGQNYDTPTERQLWRPTLEAGVSCPGDMIALGDAALTPSGDPASPVFGRAGLNAVMAAPGTYWNPVMRGLPAGDKTVRATRQRHAGRWNIAFCDGHIENLRPTSVFEIRNPLVARRWNNDHLPHLEDNFIPPPPP